MDTLRIQSDRIEIATKAARKGGEIASELKNSAEQDVKDNGTIVTEADRKAEHKIREFLSNETPYNILGEEHGGTITDEHTYWVIDPIDGTNNYSYKQPFYGTAVALVEQNEPTVGVFHMPELGYTFYAQKDRGAYCNTKQLSIANTQQISDAYIMFSGVGRGKIQPSVSAELNEWNQQLGSAVMGESWVASGWSDVGVYGALAPWDVAVGYILINESGGIMQTIQNGEKDWDAVSEGRVIFGNKRLVNSMYDEFPQEAKRAALNATYKY